MPKRIFDGDAAWASDKIATVEPAWVRPEYAWLHSICGANGVFEFSARRIWARCYAFNRPEVTVEKVEQILQALEQSKLLFSWEQDGKHLGYWTGSEKPGRLPRESWRQRDAKRGTLPPNPPAVGLNVFLARADNDQTREERAPSTADPCNEHGKRVLRSGFGSGSGLPLVENLLSDAKSASDAANHDSPNKPDQKPKAPPSEAGLHLAGILRDGILSNNQGAKITDAKVAAWAHEADRIIRLDGRSEQAVSEIIQWSQRDSFWKTNILSMNKLREKFDQLVLKKNCDGGHDGIKRGNRKPAGAISSEPGKYDRKQIQVF